MTDWLIISAAKIMKLAILTTVSLVTPPDDPAPHSVIPGVAPCCRGTMMLMSHDVTVDEAVVTNFEVREISL